MRLLVDATAAQVASKRRIDALGVADLAGLQNLLWTELGLDDSFRSTFLLEVWDGAFDEWCLLTNLAAQMTGDKARLRLVHAQPGIQAPASHSPEALRRRSSPSETWGATLGDSAAAGTKRSSRNRIVVPQYVVNGGMDLKFREDSKDAVGYPIELHDMLTRAQYTESIQSINQKTHSHRATGTDMALFWSAPLLLPLAAYGARNYRRKKAYKRTLMSGIDAFNDEYPLLSMSWLKQPISQLVIEWKSHENNPSSAAATTCMVDRTPTDVADSEWLSANDDFGTIELDEEPPPGSLKGRSGRGRFMNRKGDGNGRLRVPSA